MCIFTRYATILYIILIGFSCQSNNQKILDHPYQPRAHAHNDYNHVRPFYDAMEHNFTSVEADIHLVNGELLVAHELEDVKPGMTLQYMYLDPIKELLKSPNCRFNKDFPLILLIDIKSDSFTTFQALNRVLAAYKGMMTIYKNNKTIKGPVAVILSGNRPTLDFMANEPLRYTSYDGRITDLNTDYPASLVSMISNNWQDLFEWYGNGAIPVQEKEKLEMIVKTAHAKGQRVRFWGTDVDPILDQRMFWNELILAQVDFINTDKLDLLEHYLINRKNLAQK